MFPCCFFASASFLCVFQSDLSLELQYNEEMKVGEGGFVPEIASMLAKSLLALGGLDHILDSIVQCYWLSLHLSSVPMKFRLF